MQLRAGLTMCGARHKPMAGPYLQDSTNILLFIRLIILCIIEQLLLLRLIACKARIAQLYEKNIENLSFLAKTY